MYEIVKKKSITLKIILGIIFLFVLTSLLKVFLKEPKLTIDKELVLISNEVNKLAPVIIDSTTRLDNVSALMGNKLQYNYTLTNFDKEEIDTVVLKENTIQNMKELMNANPKAKYFKDNKIEILVNYVDQKGDLICNFSIPNYD